MIRRTGAAVLLTALCLVLFLLGSGVDVAQLSAPSHTSPPTPIVAPAGTADTVDLGNQASVSSAVSTTTAEQATGRAGGDGDSAAAAFASASKSADVSSPRDLVERLRRCPAAAFGQARPGNTGGAISAHVPPWTLTDDIIDNVCRHGGTPRRPPHRVPKLIYAVMFGLEFDMLEVALHEAFPVADVIFVTESSVTHSLGRKALHFDKIKHERYGRFLPKIRHLVYSPVRQYKSGWDVEKRQRNHFLRHLSTEVNVTDGDIVLGNIDLDEIYTRETLVRMKYCEPDPSFVTGDGYPFRVVHFRYSTNCVQEPNVNTYFDTAFMYRKHVMTSGSAKTRVDLYSRRRNRDSKPIVVAGASSPSSVALSPGSVPAADPFAAGVRKALREYGAWHLTAFGGVQAILDKYKNSPHRFVAELTPRDVLHVMNNCSYQGTPRWKLAFWGAGSDPAEAAANAAASPAPAQTTGGSGGSDSSRPILDTPWWAGEDAGESKSSSRWPVVLLPYAVVADPCPYLARGWFR